MPPDNSSTASRLQAFVRNQPGRAVATAVAVLVALLIAAVGVGALVARSLDQGDSPGQWLSGGNSSLQASPRPDSTASVAPSLPSVTFSAVGDIILGDAGRLPANDGEGFFDGVRDSLAADLVMGNLEQPLTDDTGHRKCAPDSTACHAFRVPPHYAEHLVDGGFDLLNIANNHGNDYGVTGRENTQTALDAHGIAHTGERDQITVVDVQGVSVAVLGFSPYAWTNDLNDHQQAAAVVSRADEQADLVVVQVHMGAEGSDATRVSPGSEEYFGENRGDPMAFGRAVIDAGADLVVGHGPHVLRGLEFYEGKLIAYSLGNFAGAGILRSEGPLGQGAILQVELTAEGEFLDGALIATHMYDAGLPKVDPQLRGLDLARNITELDFPDTGAVLGESGTISHPDL